MLEIHHNVTPKEHNPKKINIVKLILMIVNKKIVKGQLIVSCVVNLNMVLTLKLKDKNVYNNVD